MGARQYAYFVYGISGLFADLNCQDQKKVYSEHWSGEEAYLSHYYRSLSSLLSYIYGIEDYQQQKLYTTAFVALMSSSQLELLLVHSCLHKQGGGFVKYLTELHDVLGALDLPREGYPRGDVIRILLCEHFTDAAISFELLP